MKETIYVNLTPYVIKVVTNENKRITIKPNFDDVYMAGKYKDVGNVDGITVYRNLYDCIMIDEKEITSYKEFREYLAPDKDKFYVLIFPFEILTILHKINISTFCENYWCVTPNILDILLQDKRMVVTSTSFITL